MYLLVCDNQVDRAISKGNKKISAPFAPLLRDILKIMVIYKQKKQIDTLGNLDC